MRLPTEVVEAGYRLIHLASTGSTNHDALAAARDGDPGRLWIVADEQRAGRGRHGRSWSSPAGNLYASLLLVEPCAPAEAAQLGFVAGLSLHDAVAALAGLGAPRLQLKWPNDLLLDGAKCAGILLEGQMSGRFAVVIGFGVNVRSAPAGTPYPVTHLAAPKVTTAALFPELAGAFARRFEDWRPAADGADPFGAVRQAWMARAAGIGGPVALRLPGRERHGTFAGLDREGRLELRTPDGVELIDAGDLFFPHLQHSPATPG